MELIEHYILDKKIINQFSSVHLCVLCSFVVDVDYDFVVVLVFLGTEY